MAAPEATPENAACSELQRAAGVVVALWRRLDEGNASGNLSHDEANEINDALEGAVDELEESLKRTLRGAS